MTANTTSMKPAKARIFQRALKPQGIRMQPRDYAILHAVYRYRRLTREQISDDELARARALIETEELAALSRVEERADRLSMYATLFDEPDLINQMLGRYLAVTADDIRAVARDVFRADNRVVLTYLPELPPAETATPTSDEADATDGNATSDAETDEVAA